MTTLHTERLELVPTTVPLLEAARRGHQALATALSVDLPESWPPEHYDESTVHYSLIRLTRNPGEEGWGMYLFVRRGGGSPLPRHLIGFGGFKGEPTPDGTVEIGYSVVREFQGQGLATEAVQGFLRRAFGDSRVVRVIAETYPDLVPSQAVLRKAGFELTGPGSEADVIRFILPRERWAVR